MKSLLLFAVDPLPHPLSPPSPPHGLPAMTRPAIRRKHVTLPRRKIQSHNYNLSLPFPQGHCFGPLILKTAALKDSLPGEIAFKAHQSEEEGKSHDERLWRQKVLFPPDDEAAGGQVLPSRGSLGNLCNLLGSRSESQILSKRLLYLVQNEAQFWIAHVKLHSYQEADFL